MANEVIAIPFFETRYKRFLKKFSSLEQEINDLGKKLKVNPTLGVSLGAGLYKIRLASRSKGGGKSGGFRIVTYLVSKQEDGIVIYLITMFDKSEESSVKKTDLLKIVKRLFG